MSHHTRAIALPVAQAYGGILLDGTTDDALLLLDRYARRSLRIRGSFDTPEEASGLQAHLTQFLTETANGTPQGNEAPAAEEILREDGAPEGEAASEAEPRLAPAVAIHASLEDVYGSPPLRRGYPALVEGLQPIPSLDLVFYFATPPADWEPLLRWLLNLAAKRDGYLIRHIVLSGPFTPLKEKIQEILADMVVQLHFAIGLWPGRRVEDAPVWLPVLHDLARFGFRIPLVGYVHEGNCRQLPGILAEALSANQYSGFALPLAYHHPWYTFQPGQPALPDEMSYLQLLTEVYQDFPYFDDVFFPVAELARFVRAGGWNAADDVPSHLRLLAKPDGVFVFRQVPALARPWMTWDDLARLARDHVPAALHEAHRTAFSWARNPACAPCAWRYVCGGFDPPEDPTQTPPAGFDVTCSHRKFFLEVLLRQAHRLAD